MANAIFARKGTQNLWIRYRYDGKMVRESTGTPDPAEAQRLLALREGAVARGDALSPRSHKLLIRQLLADLVEDYRVNGLRSLPNLTIRIRLHLNPFFGDCRAMALSSADCRRYIALRQAAGAAAATINRELAALKRAYCLAVQGGTLMRRPHIPMLREQNVRTGFFEPVQLAAVLSFLPVDLRPVVTFLAVTGWRVGEVLPMQWRQVDFQAGSVRLEPGTTKNGAGRTFPFTPELRALLEARRLDTTACERRLGRIIPSVWTRDGQPILDFRRAWKRACRLAGVPGRLVHDLRRTAVRGFVRAGISERVAMQLSGHQTRSVFERYNCTSDRDLVEAAEKLERTAAFAGGGPHPASDETAGWAGTKHL